MIVFSIQAAPGMNEKRAKALYTRLENLSSSRKGGLYSSMPKRTRSSTSNGSNSAARKSSRNKRSTGMYTEFLEEDSSSSDDSRSLESLPPPSLPPKRAASRKKRSRLTLPSESEDESLNDIESSESEEAIEVKETSRRRGRQRRQQQQQYLVVSDSDSSEELENEEEDEVDNANALKIHFILAEEKHTKREWSKLFKDMNTNYITNGSILEERSLKDYGTTIDEGEELFTKFLIKWKNFSYLHVSWESEAKLVELVESSVPKIRNFREAELIKRQHEDLDEDDMEGGDEHFNPDFCQVDRILETHEFYEDNDEEEPIVEYYVKWDSLPYDECTWEQMTDIHDDTAVSSLALRSKVPPPKSKKKHLQSKSTTSFRAYTEENGPKLRGDIKLRDYQLTGVNWLIFNWLNDRNSILADEMGLGKTLQTVSLVNHLVNTENLRGPYLIVAPLSTLPHWRREFTRWTALNVIVYHGSQEAREIIRKYEFKFDGKKQGSSSSSSDYKFHVLITSPETCLTSDAPILAKIPWEMLVVDEAHRLKNRKARLYGALQNMKKNSIVLLTGTPLQNTIEELWSLLHFLDPETFEDSEEFIESYGDMKKSSQVTAIHQELRPYLLRRLKEDVEKSIAPKEETLVEIELTVLQKQYYRAIYETNVQFLGRNNNSEGGPSLCNILMEIRKCCNHPYLISGAEEKQQHHLLEEQRQQNPKLKSLSQESINEALILTSGKLVFLDKLLPRLKQNGHRVLIFSQFKIMLNILEDYLNYRRYKHERIDGSITGNDRQAAIDRFCDVDSSSFIMLLSTKAGGVGINLTAADTCIIYDSDWNPQNDLQAQARCHRIGQKKSVKIYRLLTKKTYEEQMFHQASMKLGLDQAVLGALKNKSSSNNRSLSKSEIESLLKHGAYKMFQEEKDGESEATSKEFCEADLDQILERSTTIVHDTSKGSSNSSTNALSNFSKATFVAATGGDNDVEVNDPNFWTKVVGLPTKPVIIDATPKKRRCATRKRYSETQIIGNNNNNDAESEFEDYNDFSSVGSSDQESGVNSAVIADLSTSANRLPRNVCFKIKTNLSQYGYEWPTRPAAMIPRCSASNAQQYMVAQLTQQMMAVVVNYRNYGTASVKGINSADKGEEEATAIENKVGSAADNNSMKEAESSKASASTSSSSKPTVKAKISDLSLADLETVVKSFTVCGKVIADAALMKRCVLPPSLEAVIKSEWIKRDDEQGEFTKVLELQDICEHPNVINDMKDQKFSSTANMKLNGMDLCTRTMWEVERFGSDRLLRYARARKNEFGKTDHPETTAAWTAFTPKERECLGHWSNMFMSSKTIPVEGWIPGVDDILMLIGIYKHGWAISKKVLGAICSDPDLLLLDSVKSSSTSLINHRVKLIFKTGTRRPSRSFSETSNKTLPTPMENSEIPSGGDRSASWPMSAREGLVQLVTRHGLPDIPLDVASSKFRHEADAKNKLDLMWKRYLNESILQRYGYLNEVYESAKGLIDYSRKRASGVVASVSRPQWDFLSVGACSDLLERVDLFHIMRKKIGKTEFSVLKKGLCEIMNTKGATRPQLPGWWVVPSHDIALLQGVDFFGLDECTFKIWQMKGFENLANDVLPSAIWVERTFRWLVCMLVSDLDSQGEGRTELSTAGSVVKASNNINPPAKVSPPRPNAMHLSSILG